MNATTQTIVQGNLPGKCTPPRGREPLAESNAQPLSLKSLRPLLESASKACIASLGELALPAVLEAAKSPDAVLRLNAIDALGAIASACHDSRDAIEDALNKALSDPNPVCRDAAADELRALGRNEDELVRLICKRISNKLPIVVREREEARKQAEAQKQPPAEAMA